MSDIDGGAGFTLAQEAVHPHRARNISPLYRRFLKRTFDLACALACLPVVLPLTALFWLLTTLDGGSGLYGHVRIGRHGQAFTCWKIRTMVPDAEQRLARHLAANPFAAQQWACDHKLSLDPRVTPLGRVLRATSLDELPQIWNVLRGQMSFVGPRPITAAELHRYGPNLRFYLDCRPGLTGIWQVSGRNGVTYDDRIAMDREYAETISFAADIMLILRTIPAVLRRTGI